MKIEFIIPLTKDLIVSEANRSGEHWTKKHKRHQQQKFLMTAFMTKYYDQFDFIPIMIEHNITKELNITLTRIAPRSLDKEENLPCSVKYFKDYIADFLIPNKAAGRADDSKQLTWVFKQEKGKPKEYALKVEIASSQNRTDA